MRRRTRRSRSSRGSKTSSPPPSTAKRPDAGVMHCRLDGTATDLEIPLADARVGAPVRIAIRAGDILLANQEPRG